MQTRRRFLSQIALGATGIHFARSFAAMAATSEQDFLERISTIEDRVHGRLGVAVIDTETGRTTAHRGDERFAMCSTFKMLAAAAVLKRVEAGQEDLGRRIVFGPEEVVTYSPATQGRAGPEGMPLAEMCEAALTLSDNTAANQILKTLGGPAGLTAFARAIGDEVTRLDRWETELNSAIDGDPRDTTTPVAMARNLNLLLLGEGLAEASKKRLIGWMVANKTGDARLRAGLPKDWVIGDKTGSGDFGTANDVAILWPAGRRPLIVAVYLTQTTASMEARNAAIADVGRALRASFGP